MWAYGYLNIGDYETGMAGWSIGGLLWGLTSNRWLVLVIFRCKALMSLSIQVLGVLFKTSS